jgi:rhamnose utilization protein RhaD (predicted bifunctional aldolase and dehydrogenase)
MSSESLPPSPEILHSLLDLSHELGREERRFAILGEGNTSVRISGEEFMVKASGSSLSTLNRSGVSLCRTQPIFNLFQTPDASDDEIESVLLSARRSDNERKPSTEALFHAYLLSLPDVHYVGHTHPEAVNSLLCSPHAADFASKRLFPDQIVCCGATSPLVPYVHPGVPLALAIQAEVESHINKFGEAPRLVLLRNHGLIAMGKTPNAVLAATLMAEKAARIFLGAASIGAPEFMPEEQVARIAGWNAEHYRQKVLGL